MRVRVVRDHESWKRATAPKKKQHCRFDGVCSEDEFNDLGVPQATVIGPILFILYINENKIVKFSKVSLFADDTLLSISEDNVSGSHGQHEQKPPTFVKMSELQQIEN
jgi:hypothetical protein